MSDNAVGRSERMIVSIVHYLAEQGVSKTNFSVSEIGWEKTREDNDLFVDAMTWLRNEGVIRSGDRHEFYSGKEGETYAGGFRLTSHGFALLAQPFKGELTLGGAIQKAAESGRSYSGLGDLIGGVLGGFTKSIGS